MNIESGRYDNLHGDEDEIYLEELQNKIDYESDHQSDYKYEDDFLNKNQGAI